MDKEKRGETPPMSDSQSEPPPCSQLATLASQDGDLQLKGAQLKSPASNSSSAAPAATRSNAASHHRGKYQKHVVGGGGGRLHARVSSAKALHKLAVKATSESSQQATQPAQPGLFNPSSGATAAKRPQIQRRVTAEARVSQTSANIRSQTHLKRNSKSHAELSKKVPPTSAKVKRSESVTKLKSHKQQKSQVHFDLGNQENDEEEEEWVDASGSASPYLSRRTSVASTAPHGPINPLVATASVHEPQQPSTNPTTHNPSLPQTASSQFDVTDTKVSLESEKSFHNQYLTDRVLQRIPSHGTAPPKMSSDTVEVPLSAHSPELRANHVSSAGSHQTTNTLANSGKDDEVSSRFINNSSNSAKNEGSFYNPKEPDNKESHRTTGNNNGPRRPMSAGDLVQARRSEKSPNSYHLSRERGTDKKRDGERVRIHEGGLSSGPSRRRATAADGSRTQQKLNLMRASSTLEPNPAHNGHLGEQSPIITGASDPRAGKILERTGMEYLVVRRHQNPVARSIARLNQLPMTERSRRIPASRQGVAGSRVSGGLALGQSFRQSTDLSRPVETNRPMALYKDGSKLGDAAGTNFEGRPAQDEDLSGSSLTENANDNTTTLLRSIWDRRLDFASASQ